MVINISVLIFMKTPSNSDQNPKIKKSAKIKKMLSKIKTMIQTIVAVSNAKLYPLVQIRLGNSENPKGNPGCIFKGSKEILEALYCSKTYPEHFLKSHTKSGVDYRPPKHIRYAFLYIQSISSMCFYTPKANPSNILRWDAKP